MKAKISGDSTRTQQQKTQYDRNNVGIAIIRARRTNVSSANGVAS